MQYYHEDPKNLHVGTLANRSYFIPYSSEKEALRHAGWGDDRASDRALLLSGEWDFAYFPSIEQVPETISSWDKIPVPSVWQNHGYDRHQYSNVRYPIPFDPPYVPSENPCGVYRRAFTLAKKAGERYHLNFEGVDSCYYVFVNGTFVGFSQVSHSTSEFDITDYARDGENTLVVYVLKWCMGTYLEDQDKLRMSGIFRDVYILTRPQSHLRDYTVKIDLPGDHQQAVITVALDFSGEALPTTATLHAPDGAELSAQASGDEIRFHVPSPALWTAETPVLYTLLLTCGGESIAQQVGIRSVGIRDGVLMLNDAPIMLRGVNRHDSDPVTGYAISRQQMLRDLALMKQHNVNAIRTSHYPNAPWMVQMCDAFGFYVMDESDIEAHGVCTIYESEPEPSGINLCNRIAEDPLFAEAMLDRVQRNVIRDKNSSSVIIWSLGNESGFGPNLQEAGRWVKTYDPSRLCHYERAFFPTGQHHDTTMLDFYSRMYPSLAEMVDYLENDPDTRPYVLCEYIHAMGNGPGDALDYQRLFDKYPRLCGGFVWEFCDHAVDMGITPDGRRKYGYGGDFGEYPHDGNFCMDGLVYPDRKPHTGFAEFKQVIRPVRAELMENGAIRLQNHLDFTSLGSFATASYRLTVDGKITAEGAFALPDTAPHASAEIGLPVAIPEKGKAILTLLYHQKENLPLTPAGHPLGFDQLVLREGRVLPALPEAKAASTPTFRETATHIYVHGDSFGYVFNKFTGLFDSMCYNQAPLLARPMGYNIWRAPTDNDQYIRLQWEAAGYNHAQPRVYTATARVEDGNVIIDCDLSLAAVYRQRIMTIHARFAIDPAGRIDMRFDCLRDDSMPSLPRFGLRLFLPESMDQATYFGYGPQESYVDKRQGSRLDTHETTARQNHEDYIKPQENGSHYGCDHVQVAGADGLALTALGDAPISFNLSPYTQEELTEKQHNYELTPAGHTVLCLDYKQNGIGSNSCGPVLLDEYSFNERKFTFALKLVPTK